MPKQSKVDCLQAYLRVTIPLNVTTYDAAMQKIQDLRVDGALVEIKATGLARVAVAAPIPPTPAAAVTDPKQSDDIPSFLRKPKP